MTGERNANAAPAPAAHMPIVMVWPDWFITYASASTAATVRIAHLSWLNVVTKARTALRGETPSASMVTRPEMNIIVPAAGSQLKFNNKLVSASPLAFVTCSPGQLNSLVQGDLASASLTGLSCAVRKTAMMIAYGAYARRTSARESFLRSSLRSTSRSRVGLY